MIFQIAATILVTILIGSGIIVYSDSSEIIENNSISVETNIDKIIKENITGMFEKEESSVEIIKINKLEKGVEVFARVWEGEEQYGFGKDGSVDIEKFTIINPPILVPDGTTSKLTIKDFDGSDKIVDAPNLKEDPKQYIINIIIENAKIVGKLRTNIIEGKIGRSTLIVYPVAGANSPCDGHTYKSGANEIWDDIRVANGTGANVVVDWMYMGGFATSATTDQYVEFYKGFMNFNTSDLTDGVSISVAILTIAHWNKHNQGSLSPSFAIYKATPATTNTLAFADQQSLDLTTELSTPLAYADAPSVWKEVYNITLNTAGKNYINKTGITSFGFAEVTYDANNVEPTWTASDYTSLSTASIDYAGTHPYLTITYNTSATSTCDCSSIQAGTTIDCSENCDVSACDASTEDIVFSGIGTITISGDISNHGDIYIKDSCNVICTTGCFKK